MRFTSETDRRPLGVHGAQLVQKRLCALLGRAALQGLAPAGLRQRRKLPPRDERIDIKPRAADQNDGLPA